MLGFGGLVFTLLGLGHIGTQIAKEKLEPERKYIPPQQPEKKEPRWGEPHRDEYGHILIADNYQRHQDIEKYGALQAQAWAKEGKYNMPYGQYRSAWSPEIKYHEHYKPPKPPEE